MSAARWTVEQARAAGIAVPPEPKRPIAALPRPRSVAEAELERQLCASGMTGWVAEYRFDSTRRWRLDFAFPSARLAIEVDGGVHRIKGRFAGDIDKHNALTLAGWRLLRFDAKWIATGRALEAIEAALAAGRSIE